jgi:ubiquinone/menaquinone biosynthesis C-methylase UbiE
LTIERVFSEEGFATEYAKKHKKMAEKFGQDYSFKLKSCGFRKGRIIDIGCGSGGTAITLAKNLPESKVFGIDLSGPLLRIANQTAQTAGLGKRITFEMADVHNIPYDDHYFDVVLNMNMVHLVEDPRRKTQGTRQPERWQRAVLHCFRCIRVA